MLILQIDTYCYKVQKRLTSNGRPDHRILGPKVVAGTRVDQYCIRMTSAAWLSLTTSAQAETIVGCHFAASCKLGYRFAQPTMSRVIFAANVPTLLVSKARQFQRWSELAQVWVLRLEFYRPAGNGEDEVSAWQQINRHPPMRQYVGNAVASPAGPRSAQSRRGFRLWGHEYIRALQPTSKHFAFDRQGVLVGYADIALGEQELHPNVLRHVRGQPQSPIKFAIVSANPSRAGATCNRISRSCQ